MPCACSKLGQSLKRLWAKFPCIRRSRNLQRGCGHQELSGINCWSRLGASRVVWTSARLGVCSSDWAFCVGDWTCPFRRAPECVARLKVSSGLRIALLESAVVVGVGRLSCVGGCFNCTCAALVAPSFAWGVQGPFCGGGGGISFYHDRSITCTLLDRLLCGCWL